MKPQGMGSVGRETKGYLEESESPNRDLFNEGRVFGNSSKGWMIEDLL